MLHAAGRTLSVFLTLLLSLPNLVGDQSSGLRPPQEPVYRRSLIGSEGGILHPSRYEASPEYVVKFIATYEKEGGLPP